MNYDKIFQFLFNKAGLAAFQGFDTEVLIPDHSHYIPLNPLRILEDRSSNCIYHLHGNASWYVDPINAIGLPSYNFYLTSHENLATNEDFNVIEMEKGKQLFISNIVTGYQKTQRTSLFPFRQMAASFDMDCLTADELVVIGYSFGDEHINDIIRQARKFNNKLEITIIDPDPKRDREFYFGKFLAHWEGVSSLPIFNSIENSVEYSDQYKVRTIKKYFKDYLAEANHPSAKGKAV